VIFHWIKIAVIVKQGESMLNAECPDDNIRGFPYRNAFLSIEEDNHANTPYVIGRNECSAALLYPWRI